MLRTTLSILGLYNWNPNIFSGLKVPAGMNRQIVIDEILAEAAELELLYSDWDVMQHMINTWSMREQEIWTKMWKSTQFKYNPLWNVDGTTVETEQGTRTYHHEQSNKDTSTNTDSVQGYNVGSWTDSRKNINEVDYGKQEDSRETPDITKTTVRQGNIGVTKSTELINDFRKTEAFDAYRFIIDSFINRFCIQVY